MLHRTTHNGTHSARQALLMEILLDHLKNSPFSEEEKLHLILAAYFLRAGRVDESSHKHSNPDDYYTRSALIYEAYAKQISSSRKTIEWIKLLIKNSCIPQGIRDPAVDSHDKNRIGYELLTLVHEVDLIRVFSKAYIEAVTVPAIQKRLIFLATPLSYDTTMDLGKKLCEITGVDHCYSQRPPKEREFVLCSTRGDYCWERVARLAPK